jgi:amino-acid N-acetyltransferase
METLMTPDSSPAAEVDYSMADASATAEVRRLLADAGLPNADIESCIEHFVVARHRGVIVATAGIEPCGEEGLLRSVCVHPDCRRAGVANSLCQLIESYARNLGVRRLYLLTTTAEGYFAKRGFKPCARQSAPLAIQQTREFRSLCPDTAVCMARPIQDGALHLPAAVLPVRSDIPGARTADCCGGAPADPSACCVADELSKNAGKSGCGCRTAASAGKTQAQACCG